MNTELDRNGYRPSIVQQSTDHCIWCGRKDGKLDRHEIYHGSYRNKSKQLGLWVILCHEHHMELHHKDPHKFDDLKQQAQYAAQKEYGWSTDDFIREFGKNYL